MRTILLAAILLSACGEVAGAPVALDDRVRFTADGAAEGLMRVHLDGATAILSPPLVEIGSLRAALSVPTSDLSFAVRELALGMELRNGHGYFSRVEVPLGDLRLFAEWLPAEGLMLRQLVLRVGDGTRLDVERSAEDSVTLSGSTALFLDWKLELIDGSLYPLGALPLGPMGLRASVARDADGAVAFQLFGSCAEDCGGLEEVVALDGGMIYVNAPVNVQPF
jgi:hypothetical protein